MLEEILRRMPVVGHFYCNYKMDKELKTIPLMNHDSAIAIYRDACNIRSNQGSYTGLYCLEAIKIVGDYSEEQKVSRVLHYWSQRFKDFTLTAAAIYKKYPEYHRIISDSLGSQMFVGTKVVLKDDIYMEIKESSNPVKKFRYFLHGRYHNLRKRIENGKIFSDEDLEVALDIEDQMLEIHKKRKDELISILRTEYWHELNRAISQADDFEGKRNMLKQYCKEVSSKIRENARDLMVVRSA